MNKKGKADKKHTFKSNRKKQLPYELFNGIVEGWRKIKDRHSKAIKTNVCDIRSKHIGDGFKQTFQNSLVDS